MTRNHRIVSVLLAGALAPLAAVADSVHLKNGQIFDGVEASVSGDTVQIDLAIGGRMRLPMSQVASIDEVGSTLGEYRERESRLRGDGDASGWLELARWARANEFEQGAEKAALMAARLDPDLPALEPVMASIGYVLDAKAREWLPYADAMRRQGLVEDDGQWVSPEEKHERSRQRDDAVADEPRSRADDHLDKALDILAEAVKQPEEPSNTTVIVQQPGFGGYGFGYGVGFVPGFGVPFIGGGVHHPVVPFPHSGGFFRGNGNFGRVAGWDALSVRQPGSFIPLSYYRR